MASSKRKRVPASAQAVVVPSVRTYRLWTPAQIRAAEQTADTGNIRAAVDLCDWLLGDDKVRGALDGRLNALFGLTPAFDVSGDRRRGRRAVRALEAGEDFEAIFPETEARQIHYWALLLGVGPFTLDWRIREESDGRDVPTVVFQHPQPLGFDWTARSWTRRPQSGAVTALPIAFGDGLWCAHQPFGTYRPWSLGLWRGIARWCLLKAYAISDWGRLGESASRTVVEVDPTSEITVDRKELASDISALARDAAIILPPGFRYKLVEASASTKELYDSQIRMADLAIAITIRGGNLSTNVQQGSKAAAEVQERRGDEANLRADAWAWSATQRGQVLTYWAASNFGDPKLAPWPVYPTDPEEDQKAKADVLNAALDGAQKAEQLGFELDRKAFTEAFGLSGFLSAGAKPKPPEAPPAPPTEPDEGDTEDHAEPDDAAAQAALSTPAHGTLGQRRGQRYADSVATKAAAHGARELAPTLAAVITAVRNARDYEEAKRLLADKYRGIAAPAELATLTEAAITMAQLGGKLSVRDDVPELERDEG